MVVVVVDSSRGRRCWMVWGHMNHTVGISGGAFDSIRRTSARICKNGMTLLPKEARMEETFNNQACVKSAEESVTGALLNNTHINDTYPIFEPVQNTTTADLQRPIHQVLALKKTARKGLQEPATKTSRRQAL